jgi:hypothetical protein
VLEPVSAIEADAASGFLLGSLGIGGQETHSQPLTFSETCPAGHDEACYGVLASRLSAIKFYPTRPLTTVERPTESRDIHKSIWRPPPGGMGRGVAVMNAIGSLHLGAAQSAAAAQHC